MPNKKEACRLSALAPELVDSILCQVDSVRALGSFITTCGFIHRRFQARQSHIILRVLHNELGPTLVDAKFLCLFPYSDPGERAETWIAYWDGTHTMSAVYRDMLVNGHDQVVNAPDYATLTQLCLTLHNMNFLANAYMESQLRWFGIEGPRPATTTAPFSRLERLRVLRALYRRQITCNAWAPTRRQPLWTDQDLAAIGNTSEHQGVRLGLFAAFEPWELQQIDHIDHFISRLCTSLCVAGDQQRVAQPISQAQFGNIFAHTDTLAEYMREHPAIASAALRTPVSLLRLNDPMYRPLVDRYALVCLHSSWQCQRLTTFPDPARDQQQDGGDADGHGGASIDFTQDALDKPPFGWVDALQGRYVNWFGNALVESIPRTVATGEDEREIYCNRYFSVELWRAAGFGLWDQRRAEGLKDLDQFRAFSTGWLTS